MEGNLTFERYESGRDLNEAAKTVQRGMSGEEYDYQVEWTNAVEEAVYGDSNSLKTAISLSDYEKYSQYREENGWKLDAFTSHREVGPVSLASVSDELSEEVPRTDNRESTYSSYRIPTIHGEKLPLKVTTEAELNRATDLLSDFLDKHDIEESGSGTSDPGNSGSNEIDSPFGAIHGVGSAMADRLEDDPRVQWVDADRESLSDAEKAQVDKWTDGTDLSFEDVCSVEVSTEVDIMDREGLLDTLGEDDRRMADTLIEAGEAPEEVLKRFL